MHDGTIRTATDRGSAWPMPTEDSVDHQRDIAHQTVLEQRMLSHIAHAIRATIAWELHGDDATRKIASLRFITASLQRHLEHMFDLEETDGYMAAALECSPNLADKIEALRHEHGQFRETVHRLLAQLQEVAPDDPTGLEVLCVELGDLLCRIDEHTRKEADLLQEALLRDSGGEG